MQFIHKIWIALPMLLSATACTAQIRNMKTDTVAIRGNCEMCEHTIETAGSLKKTAHVDWNRDTKTAVLEYDSLKTSRDEILKRIALAGYDSDTYFAPDEVYAALPECCHYERSKKGGRTPARPLRPAETAAAQATPLQKVSDAYFSLKDALVASDAAKAASAATRLSEALNNVKMEELQPQEHSAWMPVEKQLKTDAGNIAATSDISRQRASFASLSQNMYPLLKATDKAEPVYYQYCPMYNEGKGAVWLSREQTIKNPYYGSSMLSCGKTTETLR